MISRRAGRTALAGPLAALFSIILAGQAVAAGWSTPVTVAASRVGLQAGAIAALDGSTAVVIYARSNSADTRQLLVRRTLDGGVTWQAPAVLSESAFGADMAARGDSVDVVWRWDGRVMYRRSIDSAATFAPPIALSASGKGTDYASVARGAGGLVAVAWAQGGGSQREMGWRSVKVRVSTDGGASFGPITALADRGTSVQVAIGDGVIYVAYTRNWNSLKIKRSLDNGATWSTPYIVGEGDQGYWGAYSMAAEGSQAYVVFEGESKSSWWAILYTHTTDKGATWSEGADVLPPDWLGYDPHVDVHAGVARVIYEPCWFDWDICSEFGAVGYAESSDGSTWTEPVAVTPNRPPYYTPADITAGDKVMVLYHAYMSSDAERFYVRTASP